MVTIRPSRAPPPPPPDDHGCQTPPNKPDLPTPLRRRCARVKGHVLNPILDVMAWWSLVLTVLPLSWSWVEEGHCNSSVLIVYSLPQALWYHVLILQALALPCCATLLLHLWPNGLFLDLSKRNTFIPVAFKLQKPYIQILRDCTHYTSVDLIVVLNSHSFYCLATMIIAPCGRTSYCCP